MTPVRISIIVLWLFATSAIASDIFSSTVGLSSNWAISSWGGVNVSSTLAEDGQHQIVATPISAEAVPWAGIVFGWQASRPGEVFEPHEYEQKMLCIDFEASKPDAETNLPNLQVSVTFSDPFGVERDGAGFRSLASYPANLPADSASQTRRRVCIPLPDLAGSETVKNTAGICKIALQYVGNETPIRGFCVTNLVLENNSLTTPSLPAAVTELKQLKLVATATQPDWVYRVGDRVTFRIAFTAETPISETMQITYRLGRERFEGEPVSAKVPPGGLEVDGGSLDQPGFLRLIATANVRGEDLRSLATAAVSPEKIAHTQVEPADFDAFWSEGKAALAKIPIDAQLRHLPESSGPEHDTYELSLATYDPSGDAPRFYGILSIPKAAGKYSAMLQTPGAGVRPYTGEMWLPRGQFITLEVGIHGIPVTQPEAFYENLRNGRLRDYQFQHLDNRDLHYYRRVYLGCIRALDYLATHPKWNGRNLVVRGGSQGGQLSLVTAALDSRVTAVAAAFPAYCDVTGYQHQRAGGWPGLFTDAGPSDDAGRDLRLRQIQVSGYFDTVNFARRLKVPTFCSWGYNDEVCPPTSFFAMYNTITAPKELRVFKESGHDLPGEGWGAYGNWTYSKSFAK